LGFATSQGGAVSPKWGCESKVKTQPS